MATKLTPIAYHIDVIDKYTQIKVEACMFSEEDGTPTKWCVRGHGGRMHKRDGLFSYEPMNSSKTKTYLRMHSFDTPEEAAECYEQTRKKRDKVMPQFKK